MARLSCGCCLAALLTAAAPAQTPDFAATYALAPDRAAVLGQLVAGTEDFYWYHCLHKLQTGALGEVQPLLDTWISLHGRSERTTEIRHRLALLRFAEDPGATYEYLRRHLGLRFDAAREATGQRSDLPSRLDPEVLAPGRLAERALQRHPNSLDGFTDSALPALAARGLEGDLLVALLQRLQRPDVANLPQLVARQLALPNQGGFGDLGIHRQMTLLQLDELLQLRPSLLADVAFVDVYARRLAPAAGVPWRDDPAERAAYLDRLWAFAQRLPPAHNGFKSHVLHHFLWHDLSQGGLDRERFLAFLRLPRRSNFVNPEFLQRARRTELADARGEFTTQLAAGGDDESLVRTCFEWIFRRETAYEPYAQFVREDWLRRVLAETRLLAGDPDSERWYAMLDDPRYYQQLVERTELSFPPSQRQHFDVGDPVVVHLDVKNVRTLLVKVYTIDAYAYARATGREVDPAIDLDGVEPNDEQVHTYDEPPLRRVRREFAFPGLAGAGTWVVEFVGNGMSSRAVIQKGRLHALQRIGAAGHVFRILDEQGEAVPEAVASVAGREYGADELGEIAVPFAPEAGPRTLVLGRGTLASLHPFRHRAEVYELRAGAFVERETLVAGRRARLLVRPRLLVAGVAIDLSLLQQTVLEVRAVRGDGIESLQTLRSPQWSPAGELEHEFSVPPDLRRLTVALRGKVEKLSTGELVDVAAAPTELPVNAIDETATIAQTLLGRDAEGWFVELRGRTGEPVPGRAVPLELFHRDYRDPIQVSLATDAGGRIRLGEMPGVVVLSAEALPDEVETFALDTDAAAVPPIATGTAGGVLRVPVTPAEDGGERWVSLLEMRAGAPFRDASASIVRVPGFLELRELPAGDYELRLDAWRTIPVQIADGRAEHGWAIGRHRALPLRGRGTLQLTGVETGEGELRIRLANAADDARVHVFATRYLPAAHAAAWLEVGAGEGPYLPSLLERSTCSYAAGRQLADELRYVFERRYAAKYPGNMLTRPGLLLNPWHPTDEWNAALGLGGGQGGRFGGRGGAPGPVTGGAADGGRGRAINGSAFVNLDFLPGGGRMLCNLRPDGDGLVLVPRGDLGPGQHVHVVAVGGGDVAQRSVALPWQALEPRDLTLQNGLPPEAHFAQQRRVDFVAPGGTAVIEDTRTAEFETVGTLSEAFRVLHALVGPGLAPFEFLTRWPQLTDEERRALYREHGCHELHFFLYRHDRAWFDTVLRPYLANKIDKTFFDHWLLGDDLAGYLEPWTFAQLNLVERILLLRRQTDRGDALARYVRELGELRPVSPQADLALFRTVLGSRGLEIAANELSPQQSPQEPADMAPPGADPRARGRAEGERRAQADDKGAAPAAPQPAKSEEGGAAEELQEQQERLDRDARRRTEQAPIWRGPEPTLRYIERNYWRIPRHQQRSDLIAPTEFWREFAADDGDGPFVSEHFAQAGAGLNEALLALAVLDLPFAAPAPDRERDGDRLTLRPRSPQLVVRSELLAAEEARDADPVLVRQDHFRLDDRYVHDGSERRTRYVRDEFLTGVAYGSQVVVTNPTATPRRVELLLQIPHGAMPLLDGRATDSMPVALEPFATATAEYAWYFPAAGQHAHFPVHVTADGRYLAAAAPHVLNAVEVPTAIDTGSWEHVSQDGSAAAVLEYLAAHNLHRVDLSRILWRLRDRGFFASVVELLRARYVYHDGVWSHAFLHEDREAAAEFLAHQEAFVAQCGPVLHSPLLTIEPVERHVYEHAEFMPLYHARAHQIGPWRRIANEDVAAQWRSFVRVLAATARPDAVDLAEATYYLLLLNRTEEAIAAFARVDRGALPAQLQYDYLAAYIGFFTGDLALSRQLAEQHRDHPVERWRLLFREVLQHLEEAAGADVAAVDPRDRDQQQGAQAARLPMLDVAVQGGEVIIRHENLTACEVRYHRLDVEFAFSTSPFAEQGSAAVAWVEPRRKDVVALTADQRQTSVPLPDEFRRGNIVVEVRGGGIARRATHLASAMAVQTMENYGQLQVTRAQGGAPLPKVYVKVFARLPGGQVRFHKDGYTDLRGRFDYASVSETGTAGAQRFAVLVLSEQDGAVIREVAPPGG